MKFANLLNLEMKDKIIKNQNIEKNINNMRTSQQNSGSKDIPGNSVVPEWKPQFTEDPAITGQGKHLKTSLNENNPPKWAIKAVPSEKSRLKTTMPSSFSIESEQWLTSAEVADFLKISSKTLYNLVSLGKIRRYKFGRLNRYKQSDIERLIRPSRYEREG